MKLWIGCSIQCAIHNILESIQSIEHWLSIFYNIFLTIWNDLNINVSLSGKKGNFCQEFYTLCHIKFQVLEIIGDKSILMFVKISMRFQFLLFVMSLKKASFPASLSGTKVVSVSSLSGHGLHTEHNIVFNRVKMKIVQN